ncbi:MAG TPA: TIGR01777 family oxidoreductase [Blastocatellia bacterium]|nr:TIGR01777 family oxidoreductase [Blastocatellia bacterium]
MKVLMSGSSGLIGSALRKSLQSAGEEVIRLVRSDARGADEVRWDPQAGYIDQAAIEGMDAIVHLAAESIADGRWTASKKSRIRDTRTHGTQLLCQAVAKTSKKPSVLVSASAVGFYGDRGDEVLTESSSAGSGFLAEVCRDWEAATAPAAEAGIRVVTLRIGVVLSGAGGALAKMLPPFRLGLGGRLGSGRQYMSWIVIDDLVAAIRFGLAKEQLSGPVNMVSPNPVTNAEFTRAIGKVISRPTLFPVPAFALHAAFGEMADEVLLSGARALPQKLQAAGFKFDFTTLESGLRHVLK